MSFHDRKWLKVSPWHWSSYSLRVQSVELRLHTEGFCISLRLHGATDANVSKRRGVGSGHFCQWEHLSSHTLPAFSTMCFSGTLTVITFVHPGTNIGEVPPGSNKSLLFLPCADGLSLFTSLLFKYTNPPGVQERDHAPHICWEMS